MKNLNSNLFETSDELINYVNEYDLEVIAITNSGSINYPYVLFYKQTKDLAKVKSLVDETFNNEGFYYITRHRFEPDEEISTLIILISKDIESSKWRVEISDDYVQAKVIPFKDINFEDLAFHFGSRGYTDATKNYLYDTLENALEDADGANKHFFRNMFKIIVIQ